MTRKKGLALVEQTKAYKINEILKEIDALKKSIKERELSNSITAKEIADILGFKCVSTYEKAKNIFSIEFTEGGVSKNCLELLISGKKLVEVEGKSEELKYIPKKFRMKYFYSDLRPNKKDFAELTKRIIEDIKLEILAYLSKELEIYVHFDNNEELNEVLKCFPELIKKYPGFNEENKENKLFDDLDKFKNFFIDKPKSFGELVSEKCMVILYFVYFYDTIEKGDYVVKKIEKLFKFPRIEGDISPKKSEEARLRNDINKNSIFMQWFLAISDIKISFINKSYCLSIYNRHSYWIDRVLMFKIQKRLIEELSKEKKRLEKYGEKDVIAAIKHSISIKTDQNLWMHEAFHYIKLLEENSNLVNNGMHRVSKLKYLCTKIFLIKYFASNFIMNKNESLKENPNLNEQELLYELMIALNEIIFPYLKKYIIEEIIPNSIYRNNLYCLYEKLLKEEPLIKEVEYLSEKESFFISDKKVKKPAKNLKDFYQIHKNIYSTIHRKNIKKYPTDNVQDLCDMSDEVWTTLVEPILQLQWGGILKNDRQYINGALWILHTGAPWRDLPPVYGKWKTVNQRLNRWRSNGIWVKILKKLVNTPGYEWLKNVYET